MRHLYLSEMVARMRIEELQREAELGRLVRSGTSRRNGRWKKAFAASFLNKRIPLPGLVARQGEEPC